MTERLNQWMRQSQPKTKWSADPLVGDARSRTRQRRPARAADHADGTRRLRRFSRTKAGCCRKRFGSATSGRWTQGDSFDDVARATALFDWIVRNIQLDADDAAHALSAVGNARLRPRHGGAAGLGVRADGAATGARRGGARSAGRRVRRPAGKSKFWLPALLSDGKLYLFDTRLGLPIPGKDGKGVATLAELQADPQLLRQLDLDDAQYPVTAEQLKHVTAARRRRSVRSLAPCRGDRSRSSPATTGWRSPSVPALGREAQERCRASPASSCGTSRSARSAISCASRSRPAAQIGRWSSNRSPGGRRCGRPACCISRATRRATSIRRPPISTRSSNDHREAIGLYTSPQVRPPDRVLDALASEPKKKIYSAAKDAAELLGRPAAVRRGQVRLRGRLAERSAAGGAKRAATGPTARATTSPALTKPQGKNAEADQALRSRHLAAARRQSTPRPLAQESKPQPAAPAGDDSNG